MHVVAILVGLVAYAVFGTFFGLMVLGVGFMPEGPSRTFGTYAILLMPFFPTGLLIGRIAPSHGRWIAAVVATLALVYFVWSVGVPLPLVLLDSQPNYIVWLLQFTYQGLLYLVVCVLAAWLGSKWRTIEMRSNHLFNPDALKRAG